MARENGPEKCGAPTKNNGPCGFLADSCPHESHAKYRENNDDESKTMSNDKSTDSDLMTPELIQENTEALARLAGVKSPYDGKSIASTVAMRHISKETDDRDAKAMAYADMFDVCKHPDCNDGCNGFEADTCKAHEGYDESDSAGTTGESEGDEQSAKATLITRLMDDEGMSYAEAKEEVTSL